MSLCNGLKTPLFCCGEEYRNVSQKKWEAHNFSVVETFCPTAEQYDGEKHKGRVVASEMEVGSSLTIEQGCFLLAALPASYNNRGDTHFFISMPGKEVEKLKKMKKGECLIYEGDLELLPVNESCLGFVKSRNFSLAEKLKMIMSASITL